MVKEGIVLGHKISSKGIEVDQANIEVIKDLPPPINVKGVRSFLGHACFYRRFIKDFSKIANVKGVRSFLGHAGFYRQFIKDFSKIAKPLCTLLVKDQEFKFDNDCLASFELLKERLVTTPIIIAPQWDLPFELMCDASDYAV
ncbi:hypothetical protein A2U01_0040569, partial [Trifolium medium]|nr:hypothetical protein [Trifolium medium]